MRGPVSLVVLVAVAGAVGCAKKDALPAAAVAQAGGTLTAHATSVPRGADACALEGALKQPVGTQPKPIEEACQEDLAKDELWRTSLTVLGAYASSLDALASGGKPENSGKLESALTGVRDANFVEVEGEEEQAARQAAFELVTQLGERDDKADIESVVTEAKPHVEKLCDGLLAYLADQQSRFDTLYTDIEKKRTTPGSLRCTNFGGQTLCISNNNLDHLSYANLIGEVSALSAQHESARNSVAAFCVAHFTIAQAAADGKLKDKETYPSVVGAVKDAVPVGAPATGE